MHQRRKGAILRSKARWHEHGERNTRYFFNLEKRNQRRKTVTKLKIGDNKYVNDQFAILEEEKRFYEALYKSQSIDNDTFLASPFYVESESNRSHYSSPVKELNLIVELESLPAEVNDLNIELYLLVEVKEKLAIVWFCGL